MKFKNLFNFGKNSNDIYINKADNNDNITLKFIINGKDEKSIKCNKMDSTGEIIKRFKKEIKRENDEEILFIFGLRQLDPEYSIGENGLKDNLHITVISDYKFKRGKRI